MIQMVVCERILNVREISAFKKQKMKKKFEKQPRCEEKRKKKKIITEKTASNG